MNSSDFLTDMLEKLLDAAAAWAMPSIPSTTLQRSMTKELEYVDPIESYARLYIDQYWAIYVHDGRNNIYKAPLIWFVNPNDDPRLSPNGVLTRADEWSSLTAQEFKYWMNRNRDADRNGTQRPMVVTWHGVAGVTGSFFFDNNVGMAGFIPIADNIVQECLMAYLEEEIGVDLLTMQTNPAVAYF